MKRRLTRLLLSGYSASLRHIALPRVPAAVVAAPALRLQPGLRLASYNIHKCVGTDGSCDPQRIVRVISELEADVVALQEVDRRFGDRLGLLDLQRLEAETGLTPVPVTGIRRAHGWHGNIILARAAHVGTVSQIALPGLEPRGALVADLAFAGDLRLRVIGAHFGLLRRSRRQQADILAGFMEAPAHGAVLMGDLNEWRIDAGSPLSRYIPPGTRRRTAPASFPSRRPLLPLDRIIATAPGRLSNIAVHNSVLARTASDHLPVTADWHPATGQPDQA